MTQVAEPATDYSLALAEPTAKVRWPFLATLALTNFVVMLAFMTPIQNLIPRMAAQVAGADGRCWPSG